ncbi:MAG: RNA methyltransferase [Limnohabitans sp.]|nr:RNA methyltransferase [Limnohabitans sp.]
MELLFQDQNYLAYLETFITESRKEGFKRVLADRTKHFTVVCEDVYQLHNTSAVMRSCEVFGIQELNVVEQRFGKRIDKEIAMGAEKWVDIHRFSNNQDCIDNLKNRGYQIIATTPHENDCLLEDFEISKPAALFFGTERQGLSEEIIQQADGYLKIPMFGFTESLNISVSAAIILQNLSSRLRHSNVDWKLSESELLEKRIDWTRKSIKDIDFITQKYLETLDSV